jgi:RNA polymerase sigma-70 factor, ECF subfamily
MEITELLRKARHGDEEAGRQVFPLVYGELKRLAAGHLRGRWDVTLSATALVHEAFLRVADLDPGSVESRAHFFGIASRTMRNVLVDLVRQTGAQKRGGGLTVRLDEAGELPDPRTHDVLLLDQALDKLAGEHPRQAKAIEMRYFGGMTAAEIALALDNSEATVQRDVRFAEAWLRREMAALPSRAR